MRTYIVLIRGINVGGKNKLPMKVLTELLSSTALAIQNIQTYLQTGNVIFQTASTEPLIKESILASIIEEGFGFKPEVMILNEMDVKQAVLANPYQKKAANTCHFYFCKTVPSMDTKRIEKLKSASEHYHLHNKVFYLYAPDGVGKSKLAKNVELCLDVKATARNLNTVNKILMMLGDS